MSNDDIYCINNFLLLYAPLHLGATKDFPSWTTLRYVFIDPTGMDVLYSWHREGVKLIHERGDYPYAIDEDVNYN